MAARYPWQDQRRRAAGDWASAWRPLPPLTVVVARQPGRATGCDLGRRPVQTSGRCQERARPGSLEFAKHRLAAGGTMLTRTYLMAARRRLGAGLVIGAAGITTAGLALLVLTGCGH